MMPSQDVALIKEGKSSHVKVKYKSWQTRSWQRTSSHHSGCVGSSLRYLLYDLAQKDERGLRGVRKIITIIIIIIIILIANEFYPPSYLLYLTPYKILL